MGYYLKAIDDVAYTDIQTTYGVKVFEVKGIWEEEAKEYYSYDWANEDGLDVYIPTSRKVKALPIELRGYILSSDADSKLSSFKSFLLSNGALMYYDDHRLQECTLAYEKMNIEIDRVRSDMKFIQFKITFTNISGKFTTHIDEE